MPIPDLDEHGFLSVGVYDCELHEIRARFGIFQGSSRRPDLFTRLVAFVAEAKASEVVEAIVVDGSFITSKDLPNDIDLLVVVASDHDFSLDLAPREYSILSARRV